MAAVGCGDIDEPPLAKRYAASVGANWRETILGYQSPRLGTYAYKRRLDYSTLRDEVGAYKRIKYAFFKVKKELEASGERVNSLGAKLKCEFKLDELFADGTSEDEWMEFEKVKDIKPVDPNIDWVASISKNKEDINEYNYLFINYYLHKNTLHQ